MFWIFFIPITSKSHLAIYSIFNTFLCLAMALEHLLQRQLEKPLYQIIANYCRYFNAENTLFWCSDLNSKEFVQKFRDLKVYLSLVICLFTFARFLSNMISVKRNFNIKTVWEKCFQRFRKWPFQEGRRNIIWKTEKHTNST